jgi:ATP-dependent Lhr-like helicase
MPGTLFHPAVAGWFDRRFGSPTEAQAHAWPLIRAGRHTLISAPTGSGKTLAAFLAALDDLVTKALAGGLEDRTEVVYVSPLKALSNDVQRNLEEPLAGIRGELAARGLPDVEIRTLVRTGDTPAAVRAAMRKQPPHILVTTPESLFILLGSDGGRGLLASARTVIVDEIHAVAGNKRGSHLSLSLARLDALVRAGGGSLARIGLSATQRPIEEVARFLVGTTTSRDEAGATVGDGAPRSENESCAIVDCGHGRPLDLGIEVPRSPLEAVMPAEVWKEVYDRIADLISQHRTTLVFVNTRRLAERAARHLAERLGESRVASHHGSLSRDQRLDSERRLKAGELAALVATASLELGIDIGSVDLVCQLGSTRSIATLMQRVGRSGHRLGALPKGRLFPASRDELVEAAALLDAVRRGELDRLNIPECPLDILAQHIVAAAAAEEWREDDLYALVRQAYPFRRLERRDFDAVVDMLANGFTTRRGRRGAYLHHDAVNGRLRARKGARLIALTSGGAIPDTADYQVVLEPAGTFLGTVHEDFAVESMPGDVFQLGNASWRVRKVEPGKMLVEDARGQSPSIPFWLGEAPARTAELSQAVSRLRSEVAARCAAEGVEAAVAWLTGEVGLDAAAARQIAAYLAAAQAALGVMPSAETLVAERFFDEAGDQHLVVHAPFGSRLNRAWGLALRKRFCQSFNFELQAAASEDAIVLSLGPTHSFPLADAFHFLHSSSVRGVVTQALLDSPLFGVRWRWNASRALALPRWRGGRRVPAPLLRQQSEDLIAVVFPDQLACLENIVGEREIPDHPLVRQTVADCLEEAMDTAGLERLLARLEAGEVAVVARDLTEPSPLAHEILNSQPYTFLDDAPLEERRTRAVQARRWLDPETAADLGALDAAAIARVRDEAWPSAESADELHDALLTFGFITAEEGRRCGWQPLFDRLAGERRAAVLGIRPGHRPPAAASRTVGRHELWVAAERLPELLALHPGAGLSPALNVPPRFDRRWESEPALVELVRGRLQAVGPTTAEALAASAGAGAAAVEAALAALEGEGFVMRGRFTALGQAPAGTEWCERRLLARIHRYTLDRLRRQIEPVEPADFLRFLAGWHHLSGAPAPEPVPPAQSLARVAQLAPPAPQAPQSEPRLHGPEGLAALLAQLEGFEAPAAAWEGEILPARMAATARLPAPARSAPAPDEDYDPLWLDALCLAGRYVWGRMTPPPAGGTRRAPVRATPIALLSRQAVPLWRELGGSGAPPAVDLKAPAAAAAALSAAARAAHELLCARGASFFGEIAAGTGLLHTQLEAAVAELVAAGLVTADSFTGLRALLVPAHKRPPVDRQGLRRREAGSVTSFRVENAGRWSLLAPAVPPVAGVSGGASSEAVTHAAWVLLRRYGVVCRRLLEREALMPPWRDLLPVLRRLEARGEIRGGRFINGFSGEQYALAEAVGKLRAVRREPRRGTLVSVSAADPLNLVGIATPGDRLPALAGNRLLMRDGEPIAIYEGREARFLVELPTAERWQAQSALVRRTVAPRLKAYLGRSA